MPNLIALAIPFFLLLLLLELLVSRLTGRRVYRFDDSIADLGCGVGDQVIALLLRTATLLPYTLVYETLAPHTLATRPVAAWLAAIVGVDFTYYWYHRFCHRVNFAWATHVVHHQSDEYNLAVALRQSWFGRLFHWVFDLPLALVGVPPALFVASTSINLLYQFWVHTRLVGRLGPFELAFNTPSHHRVHHGCNVRYLDRNYAGILIVWDRLFGTFRREEDEPVYGTVKPFASRNPLWANLQPFVSLAGRARRAPRAWDRVQLWFRPPEWVARGEDPVTFPTDAALAAARSPGVRPRRSTNAYLVGGFAAAAAALMAIMLRADSIPKWWLLVACGSILASLGAWGGLLERRRWALPLELARLAALLVAAALLLPTHPIVSVALAGVTLASLAMTPWLRAESSSGHAPAIAS